MMLKLSKIIEIRHQMLTVVLLFFFISNSSIIWQYTLYYILIKFKINVLKTKNSKSKIIVTGGELYQCRCNLRNSGQSMNFGAGKSWIYALMMAIECDLKKMTSLAFCYLIGRGGHYEYLP